MVSGLNARTFLTLIFVAVVLNALGSPMTAHVFTEWFRVASFAVGLGTTAVLHAATVLSQRKSDTDPIDPSAVPSVPT